MANLGRAIYLKFIRQMPIFLSCTGTWISVLQKPGRRQFSDFTNSYFLSAQIRMSVIASQIHFLAPAQIRFCVGAEIELSGGSVGHYWVGALLGHYWRHPELLPPRLQLLTPTAISGEQVRPRPSSSSSSFPSSSLLSSWSSSLSWAVSHYRNESIHIFLSLKRNCCKLSTGSSGVRGEIPDPRHHHQIVRRFYKIQNTKYKIQNWP